MLTLILIEGAAMTRKFINFYPILKIYFQIILKTNKNGNLNRIGELDLAISDYSTALEIDSRNAAN